MQYPPQQPTNQQSYPPSEVYQPKQSQQTGGPAPAQQNQQRVVVYANRIQASKSMNRMTNSTILRILILVPVSLLILDMVRNAAPDSATTYFLLVVLALVNVFFGARAALDHWLIGRSLLANPEPLLQFTHEGLWLRGASWPTTIFLAWSEIEAIDVYRYKYHYLCVRPRNPQLIFERLPLLERVLNFGNAVYGMSPFTFHLAYLDKPVEEILQEVYHMYTKELNHYQIQIRS